MDIILLEEISDKLTLMESNLSNKISKEISNSISNVNNVSTKLDTLDKKYNNIYVRDFSNTYIKSYALENFEKEYIQNGTLQIPNIEISKNSFNNQSNLEVEVANLKAFKAEGSFGFRGIIWATAVPSNFDLHAYCNEKITGSIFINNALYSDLDVKYISSGSTNINSTLNKGIAIIANVPVKQEDKISIKYNMQLPTSFTNNRSSILLCYNHLWFNQVTSAGAFFKSLN